MTSTDAQWTAPSLLPGALPDEQPDAITRDGSPAAVDIGAPGPEPTPDVIPPVGHVLPHAPEVVRVRRHWNFRPVVKKGAIVAVLAVVAFLIYDRVITTLMFQQRQEHLAAEMKNGTPTIEPGEAVAILQAVDIDLDVVVIEGTDVDQLRGAPGRVPESALPGDAGISVIFGHRRGYGSPFEHIDRLASGQSIVVQTRSGGPITRYIVDRVEKSTMLADVKLDNADRIAYLLLVTDESSWSAGDQTIVIARALPVTDAQAILPNLATLGGGSVPYGVDALLAGVAAALSWIFLKTRTGTVVRIAIVAPAAAYAVIGLLGALDGILPLAR